MSEYDPQALQAKWQQRWEELDPFRASEDAADTRERRYVCDMFPYPSGDLHMGHGEVFAIADVVSRYWFQQGYNVLHPIGWDSFGLPAENAAIKRNAHPAEWTYANIETQATSFKRYGVSFDWSRRLHTSDPDYYRWNQWLFNRFFERGLAYRKGGLVNWCPNDQTVLANEQVVAGKCERCGADVIRRELTQWYFKITDYAQRLLDDMDQLDSWPERLLTMQRNWIGRSEGADVLFQVEGRDEPVQVYTTRPDTLFGATFFVVAADAALAEEIVTDEQRPAFEVYRAEVAKLSDIERMSTDKDKTGVFLGRYAINPVNGERIPVWAADYVLSDYGHGAIMAVPAHDQRDLDFAMKFELPVKVVVHTGLADPGETGVATPGEGKLVNSGPLDGLTKTEAIAKIIDILEVDGRGQGTVNFRLRDWLLSRQRFWGTPIPIIHCPDCGEVPVPDEQLPVTLPDMRGEALAPKGVSPLASATDWVNVECPKCSGPAKRDTDTMDTFVDSSWYFLRYCSPGYTEGPFDPEQVNKWGPIDQYVGGIEHAVLHLLYSRFFTKVLHDMGMVSFTEPFRRMLNQGQVINGGKAMSKSLGNGVDLGQQIDDFGVDAVRLTMIFAGPPEDDIDWADLSPGASQKFLARAFRVMDEVASPPGVSYDGGDLALRKATHHTIDEVTKLLDSYRFNVAVARLMELTSAARKAIDSGPGAADPAVREAAETLAVMLSLVAPYTAEEGWERLGHTGGTVARAGWPVADPALLVRESVTCVVQVAGKVRDRLEVSPDVSEEELRALALASEKVQGHLSGEPRKVIVRAPKLVNIVP
ncbi:leucine--tRNA ligase [Nonomuraea glycinis]|uniref:Leucine--tRNA ligase n=1 Tax=Nonomuraea glycinis TaxID=2047744 RepID=A0A918E779_9ACTN|nr:leucine--tRNA ligase [Nonomuraea glycinis]MCA2179216.1 leucine--tRNA ligase [Nonomuraea glycinis]GGP10144.1 leucine--tRNA ligase [Nonomuraea glycinis]